MIISSINEVLPCEEKVDLGFKDQAKTNFSIFFTWQVQLQEHPPSADIKINPGTEETSTVCCQILISLFPFQSHTVERVKGKSLFYDIAAG